MQTIALKTHVGPDGILKLELPTGVADAELEVTVSFQEVGGNGTAEEKGWPPGFFEQTAGCLRDDPIERGEQGAYEIRESLE